MGDRLQRTDRRGLAVARGRVPRREEDTLTAAAGTMDRFHPEAEMNMHAKRKGLRRRFWAAAVAVLVLAAAADAKELLVTGTAPNRILVVDPEAGKVIQTITLEGPGMPSAVVVDSRDNNRIYTITNQWSAVCAVDRKAGKVDRCVDLPSFAPKGERELVKAFSIEINPKKKELYVYEAPVLVHPSRYEVRPTRIRVLNSDTFESLRTFDSPRQGLVLASSPDGKLLYSFHVGDIRVYDVDTGKIVRTLPFVGHNVGGVGLTDGLPFYPNYAENGHIVAFPYGAEDPYNATFTTGLAYLDLRTGKLDKFEVGPFGVEQYYLGAVISPKLKRGYMSWNYLTMVDLEKRRVLKTVMMDTTRFYPTMSQDQKRIYLPRGSGSTIGVYDPKDLTKLKVIELGSNMAAASLRVIQTDPDRPMP
jgi:DNA-binding beta-propeller fold protein YncE